MNSRIGIFISGRGSNLKATLESSDACNLFVFSNKKKASGLKWAQRRGASVEVVQLKSSSDWERLSTKLNQLYIRKILLLGFMKIVPAIFLDNFKGEVINLHPSILPDFPGLNSIQKSLEIGKSVGVSLHHVNENMDEGPLIFQSALSLNKGFTLEDETLRIHSLEQHTVNCFLRLRMGVA